MAEWKPFDLKWGRSIWYCSACEESTEVPTYLGKPMYNFCPMCGANMNMKSENKQADTPQTDCGDFADRLAYERGVKHAWEVAQKVFDSTVTFYEAEDVAKQIAKERHTDGE